MNNMTTNTTTNMAISKTSNMKLGQEQPKCMWLERYVVFTVKTLQSRCQRSRQDFL